MWIWASEKEIRLWVEGVRQLIEQAAGKRDDGDAAPEGARKKETRKQGEEAERSNGPSRSGGGQPGLAIQRSLEAAIGRRVELSTIGGSIRGVLTEVGEGFAVVRESEELVVVANLDHAIYVEVSGE